MLKRWIALLMCLVAALSFSACSSTAPQVNSPEANAGQSNAQNAEKIQISVTFNAVKEFAEAVGKDKVIVSTIVPDGSKAHGFEPKAQDLVSLNDAQIFVYNGLGMDAWAEQAIQAANNQALIVVNASEGADVITRDTASTDHDEDEDAHDEDEREHEEDADHEDEHEENEHAGHSHGQYDPHLWLGLKGAQTSAINIKNALIQADPDNKDFYQQNCDSFVAELEALYTEYKGKFDSLQNKNFVTGHAAFGYLCRDFGLEQNSVRDIFAEGEPSAQQLAELVEYCRTNKVTTIFAEEMASPAVSQTLASEVGAKVETIYTIETNENGKTYLERMAQNLAKIYESLAN